MLKLPLHNQPREKLSERGPDNVTDAELLSIILGTGTKKHNVLKLSQLIIKKFPYSPQRLLTTDELTTISGVGPVKAATLIALHTLVARWFQPAPAHHLISPTDVLQKVRKLRSAAQEHLVALYINARSQLAHKQTIAIGQLNTLNIEPRELFRPAFEHPCVGLIICHNHPSGNPEPSKDDKVFTLKMQQAGKLLGLEVIDHLIVTKEGYFSFRESNLL